MCRRIFFIDSEGYYLYNSADPLRVFGFEPDIETVGGQADANISQDFTGTEAETFLGETAQGKIDSEGNELIFYTHVSPAGAPEGYYWVLALVRERSAAFSVVQDIQRSTLVGIMIVLVLATGVVALEARQITHPIQELGYAASEMAGGNLDVQVGDVTKRSDEIGQLGQTFQQMAAQIQELVSGLEGRVEARTHDLQTVFDVGKQIGSILEVDRLLQDIVDLTKERFGLYHAHIYLLTDDRQTLNLTAGAGYVGRQMIAEKRRISIDNPDSIVASSARNQQSLVINDVNASGTFLPHPLLPNTQSELAVALVVRGQTLGVLDVQSDQLNYFNESSLQVIELMAGQLSTAINNARLYSQAEKRARMEGALSKIERQILESVDLDEMLKVTVRELGKALRVPHTAIELKVDSESPNGGHSQLDEKVIEAN
jgi:putative methionine-R-sulfoxide reductase with GAF domain